MPLTGFEQFAIGEVFISAPLTIDTAAIKAFAAEFDFQAQHMDEAAATKTMFGELVASGWHTAALTMRLILQSALAGVSGRGLGLEIKEMKWAAPVRPGDSLHIEAEVLDVRPSRSKPDRGVVVMRTRTRNQHDQIVQELTSTLLILRSDAVIA